jgi:predicted ATPase/DNA-binding SARP family transcriptional activator
MADRGTTIRLLGGFEVEIHARPVAAGAWRLRKSADLVKLLALAPGHWLTRDHLLETLWPDKDPDAAANNLYQAIHGARAVLGRDDETAQLTLIDGVVSLGPPDRLVVDVDAFGAAMQRAEAGEAGARDEARSWYRGELLPEDRYEDWAVAARESLAAIHRRNLLELATLRETEGDLEAARELLRVILVLDPLDESTSRRMMQLEARTGRRAAAQQVYASLRDMLRRELDVDPDESTTQLARDIVEGRLDPLDKGVAASNLPARLTSFVGRQRELRDVERLLRATRLLTLTGTGGTGKTRLALEAAQAARGRYPDGVWLVELAATGLDADVPRALASAFGLREAPGVGLLDAAVRHIGDRRLLVLLDNCEHVAAGSATLCGQLLARCPNLQILATSRKPLHIGGELLFRVPSLAISDPAEVVRIEDVEGVDSIRLFLDRASAADPAFELTDQNVRSISELCFHLDGLPLAIELAASRAATIPVSLLADRLEERFELLVEGSRTALTRQQTLRATIDWSYELLSADQAAVFRAISVLGPRLSLEAVEAVSEHVGLRRGRILSILGELADQSLVVPDTTSRAPRFRMLETIREYAHERLVHSGELAIVEAAQIAWAIATVSRSATLPGDQWADGFRGLEDEHDSLRAALDRAMHSNTAAALELSEGMWPFWLWNGHLVEGRNRLHDALAAEPAVTQTRGRALIGLAAISARSGDRLSYTTASRQALDVFNEVTDVPQHCRALHMLASAKWTFEDLGAARTALESALELAGAAGFESGRGASLGGLAIVELSANDPDLARRRIDEAIEAFQRAATRAGNEAATLDFLNIGEFVVPEPATGRHRLLFEETFGPFRDVSAAVAAASARANRGAMRRILGDPIGARSDLEASLAEFDALGDERGQAQTLGRLGCLAVAVGEIEEARRKLTASLKIRVRLGDSRGVSLTETNLARLETLSGEFDRADSLLASALGAFRRRGDTWAMPAALANLASLAMQRGALAEARDYLEQSLTSSRAVRRGKWVAWRLVELAALADLQGDEAAVASFVDQARPMFEAIDDRQGLNEVQALSGG